MGIRTIKTVAHYRYFLAEVKRLAAQGPEPASGPGLHLGLLTRHMINALYERLDIPLELLIREPTAVYKLKRKIKRPAGGARRNWTAK